MFPVRTRLGRNVTSGQSHLNSDATIADEGRPQGAPLPIVNLFRTRNRPPVAKDLKNLRLRTMICTVLGVWPWEGHPQGVPLPMVFSRRLALGRAPTRGAPTDGLFSAFGLGKGTHKGCPYRLSSLGVWPWEGHPQGAPLPIGRLALGRAPTRGTDSFSGRYGAHKGCLPDRQPHEIFSSLMQLPCNVTSL